MRYFRTYWEHEYSDYAVWFYSEVNSEGLETRKLEVFLDGRCFYYDSETPFKLAEFPTDEEIQEVNKESEVHMIEIRKEDFERVLMYHLTK